MNNSLGAAAQRPGPHNKARDVLGSTWQHLPLAPYAPNGRRARNAAGHAAASAFRGKLWQAGNLGGEGTRRHTGHMLIAALADIHYPDGGRARLSALANACRRARPDVLILGGDLATSSLVDFGRVLRAFADVAEVRLAVAGNHDVWTPHGQATGRRYRNALPALCRRYDFKLLDVEPVRVGDVGFVGGLGWYDYSLRQLEEPFPGVRVSPARPSRRSSFSRLRVLPGREDIAWAELTRDDYRGKGLMWRERGRLRSLLWNDAIFVNWAASDEQVVADQVRHLRASVGELGRCRSIVAVTHTVPFIEAFTEPYRRVEWAFCRAYMGAEALGKALIREERLVVWITGHVHYQVEVDCKGLPVVNVAAAPEQRGAGPTLLHLDAEEVHVERAELVAPDADGSEPEG